MLWLQQGWVSGLPLMLSGVVNFEGLQLLWVPRFLLSQSVVAALFVTAISSRGSALCPTTLCHSGATFMCSIVLLGL